MTIHKTASPALPAAGEHITYMLQVTNIGAALAPNIRVTDFVPANTTFVGAGLVGGGRDGECFPPSVNPSGAVECGLIALEAGGDTRSFSITVRVNPNAVGATITNTATVTTSATESNTGNNSSTVQTQVSPVPPTTADLSVEKSRDASTPYAGRGEVATFTILVRNAGPLAAQSVTLTDAIPAQTTFESLAAPAGFTCTTPAAGAGGTVTCTAASLADQATATFTLSVRLTATASGTIANTATVSSSTPDPDSGDLASSASVTATNPGADLRVVKTASPQVVNPGENIGYTVEVTNIGSQSASSVKVVDFVPANTTFVSAGLIGGGSAGSCAPPSVTGSGAVECTLLGLGPQVSRSFGIVVRASPTAAGATITNTATVSAQTADPDTSNNSSTVQTTVANTPPAAANLSVAKSIPHDAKPFVGPTETATFVITVRNFGPLAAQNVVLTDVIPSQATFVSISAPAGFTCTTPPAGGTGTVTCTAPSLADQALVTFTLTVRANQNATGTITNTATVSSDTADPNTANNTSTQQIAVTESTGADLRLTKTASPASVNPGDLLTYTVTATNIGSMDAGPPTIEDPIPAQTTFVSVTDPPGTFAQCFGPGATNSVRCIGNGLGPGNSFTITFTVRVNAGATGTIVNTATVRGSTTNPDPPANNTATAYTPIGTAPSTADLEVVKSIPDGALPFVGPGETATFHLFVRNNGPLAAQNVVVSDVLPTQTTFVSVAAPAGFTCTTPAVGAAGTVTCSSASFPDQASGTIRLTVRANANATGTITNTATISSTTPDSTTANNTSSRQLTVTESTGADLRLTKTASRTTARPGDTIIYTITATNIGSQTSAPITVNDPVPANTTFVLVEEPEGAPQCFPPAQNNVVRCTAGGLAPGQSFTMTFTVRVNDDATGPIANTATVAAGANDPAPGNNAASVTTALPPAPANVQIPLLDPRALVLLALMLAAIGALLLK